MREGGGGATGRDGERGRGLTVIVVIADDHFLDLTVLAHLAPEVFVEGVEVVLELAGVHLVLWVVGWVLVEIG